MRDGEDKDITPTIMKEDVNGKQRLSMPLTTQVSVHTHTPRVYVHLNVSPHNTSCDSFSFKYPRQVDREMDSLTIDR